MKRIVKPAGEINPGDVVLGVAGHDPYFDPFVVLLVSHDGGRVRLSHSKAETPPWSVVMQCDVLEGAYTPAQLHAPRLAEYAEEYLQRLERGGSNAFIEGAYLELRDLVALVRPPAPVTVDEVLAALDSVDGGHIPPSGLLILDRARRAGQLS